MVPSSKPIQHKEWRTVSDQISLAAQRFEQEYGSEISRTSQLSLIKAFLGPLTRVIAGVLRPSDVEKNAATEGVSYLHLLKLFGDQWGKNQDFLTAHLGQLSTIKGQLEPVLPQEHASWLRAFNQLPCTRETANFRVRLISQFAAKLAPIALLGDDDGVSVQLHNAGFKNITVFDIDPRLLKRIIEETGGAVTCHVQDFREAIPESLRAAYHIIVTDPPCSLFGVKLFMARALELAPQGKERKIILITNLLSQMDVSCQQMHAWLREQGISVEGFEYGSSVYPMPLVNRAILGFAVAVASVLALRPQWIFRHDLKFRYFISDTFILS